MARTVDAADAREQIEAWLAEVARDGEPLTLTRDGRAVARLEPAAGMAVSAGGRRAEAAALLAEIRAEATLANGGADRDPVEIIREGREERDRQLDEVRHLSGRQPGPGPGDQSVT